MEDIGSENCCDTCRKMAECFGKGIFEREQCADYDPMSLADLAEQDELIRQVFIDDCPVCHSENTADCDNILETVRDITLATCYDCGAYWCTICGYVFKSSQTNMECPHFQICDKCSEEHGYMDYLDFLEQVCPKCEHYSKGCQLSPDIECPIQWQYVCPFLIDISYCSKIATFVGDQGQ